MASAAAQTTLSFLPTTKSSSTTAAVFSTRVHLSSFLGARPLRRLGFAAADPLLTVQVAERVRSVSGRGMRGVVSMAKKSVGDLSASELKGKRVFVRADLNVRFCRFSHRDGIRSRRDALQFFSNSH